MKLLIAGSRCIHKFDLTGYVPSETTLIITGGATGMDALAEEYADKKHLSKLVLRPQYELFGRCAPLKRNEKMIELCDMALVVWDGKSKGTKSTICYAEKKNKDVCIITPLLK